MSQKTHKQQLRVNATQKDMFLGTRRSASTTLSQDLGGQLQQTNNDIENLLREKEELEYRRSQLALLKQKREHFIQGQIEVTEKLSASLQGIDREILLYKQEIEDLNQTKTCFDQHLKKINDLHPEGWNNESFQETLDRSLALLDLAEDDYAQASEHFRGRSSALLFSGQANHKNKGASSPSSLLSLSEDFKKGLAFHLPLIALALLAILFFALK